MVKVKGKKVSLTPSEYVTKDLVGPKGKRKKLAQSLKQKDRLNSKTPVKGRKIRNGHADKDIVEDGSADEIGQLVGNEIHLAETRMSDAPPIKKVSALTVKCMVEDVFGLEYCIMKMGNYLLQKLWKNRQRLLVFGSRGISFRARHFMENLRRLLPHTKKESKMDKRDKMSAINDVSNYSMHHDGYRVNNGASY